MLLRNRASAHIAVFAISSLAFFLVISIFGEFLGGSSNGDCYRFIGCTNGFFGFDAIEHFMFGVAALFVMTWIGEKFPGHSPLHKKGWKRAFVLIASVALLSAFWELMECAYDTLRMGAMGKRWADLSQLINSLAQPSNIDSMGDNAFALLGALVAYFLSPPKKRWPL